MKLVAGVNPWASLPVVLLLLLSVFSTVGAQGECISGMELLA